MSGEHFYRTTTTTVATAFFYFTSSQVDFSIKLLAFTITEMLSLLDEFRYVVVFELLLDLLLYGREFACIHIRFVSFHIYYCLKAALDVITQDKILHCGHF